MFAPFRKGKPSKGKESYFVDIGDETILSEPDCQLEVDSAKNDDFLVLSRYVEIYAPATVTDQEFSSGAKPAEEITSSTVVYKTDCLHTGSQDQQDLAEISFLVPESDISASEPENSSDSSFVETESKQYAEDDRLNRISTSLENKETYENDLDGFANIEINSPDEVAENKDISTVENNNSPVPEHKDDYVKAILFTEEEFMGTFDDSAENEYYTETVNEYDIQQQRLLEANSQEKQYQAYTEYESKSPLEIPVSKPSANSLLRNDVYSFKEENQHPNAPLPPPAHHLKERLLTQQQQQQQQLSPRGAHNDSRFETSRTSTSLPFGLISPPQPPVRTVMEYSYVTNNNNNNGSSHQPNNNNNNNNGSNRMHQMSSSSNATTNRLLPSYTRKAPAPFTIYDDSHDTGGLGSGYRLNSHGSSSNGSDTTRSRDSFFSYSDDSNNTGRSRDSFFSYGSLSPKSGGAGGFAGASPRNQAPLDHRNDFQGGRMPMPPSSSSAMAGIAAAGQYGQEEEEEDEEFITTLFSKVRHNRIETVQDILSQGSRRTSRLRDDNGNSLLHVCAQNNLRKMASLVLSFGCEVNAINYKACSALDYAERYSFSKLADWLRSKGALRAEAIQ